MWPVLWTDSILAELLRPVAISQPHGNVEHRVIRQMNGEFPAFSWVLSLWLAGWLVVSRVCRVSVRAINRSTSSAAGKPDVIAFTSVIQRRFVIRVDSVPAESWAMRVRAYELS